MMERDEEAEQKAERFLSSLVVLSTPHQVAYTSGIVPNRRRL